MDELNEFLNLWNKSCVTTSDFELFCARSKHIMAMRKSSYHRFGKRKNLPRRTTVVQEKSNSKLVQFFLDADIFPKCNTGKRELTKDFFWDRVQRPTKIGSAKWNKIESVSMSIGNQVLMERLCSRDVDRKDYGEFESDSDDDSVQSMASTCCAPSNNVNAEEDIRVGGDVEENWENLKDTIRPEQIEIALKHLGNVKKRKMASSILNDYIGDDGDDAVKGIKKSHDKLLSREERKIKQIHSAVSYFEAKMKVRRDALANRCTQSISRTYTRQHNVWRNEWNYMNRSSSDLPSDTFLYDYLFDK